MSIDRARPLTGAVVLWLAFTLVGGCAAREPAQAESAGDARVDACRAALKDQRVACREGLKQDDAPFGFACLDARQRVERFCY